MQFPMLLPASLGVVVDVDNSVNPAPNSPRI
jgi:hypothetical protein